MKRYLIIAENNKRQKWLITRDRKLVWKLDLLKEEETFKTREEAEEEARKLDKENKELVEVTEEPHRRIKYQDILEYKI